MNARQKAKKLKKEISALKSDNDLMRRIIADSPAMQELYDAYNKPVFTTHTAMHFQEYRAVRKIPVYMADIEGVIESTKQALAQDLFDGVKENITYEVDDNCITASIFVGEE